MKTWPFGLKIANRKSLVTIIGLWVAWLVIATPPGLALAQGPIEVLEPILIGYNSSYNPISYAISGNIVVAANFGRGIGGYDLTTQEWFTVTNRAVNAWFPGISGDVVVWQDHRSGNWDIYGYDLGEGREFQITRHAADQKGPVIDGDIVVWRDWRNGGDTYANDVYGYNINTGTEFRVTDSATTGIRCLDISDHTVVWSSSHNGTWNVYAYNLLSHTEVWITQVGSNICPAISGNVIVVPGWAVYGFDLSGNLLFQIGSDDVPGPQVGPADIDGNLVVWQQPLIGICQEESPTDMANDTYIVGYDITSSHTFNVISYDYQAETPKISGDVVVWLGNPHYDWNPPFPSYGKTLYMSRLLETAQLSVNSQFVDPGDVLTYTITLAEATTTGSHRSITDSLSSRVALDISSLSATSGDYGYDPSAHAVTWVGDVSADSPVTITYNATVNPEISLGEHITNTAVISDETTVFTRTVTGWVARRTYLPVISRRFTP